MEKTFWEQWADIGKDLLEYGKQIQYGNSLVEIKFMKGNPVVIIRSKSIKTKYPDNIQAEQAIGKLLSDSQTLGFDGARTFTVAYNRGNITQVILDEYANNLLK
jgi:hypothetical protein